MPDISPVFKPVNNFREVFMKYLFSEVINQSQRNIVHALMRAGNI